MKFSQNKFNEAIVRCELYHRCREENIDSYPEYIESIDGRKCYFDLVIVVDEEIICLIECKSRRTTIPNKNTKQYRKYKKMNLPIIYCINLESVERTISKIKIEIIRYKRIVKEKTF